MKRLRWPALLAFVVACAPTPPEVPAEAPQVAEATPRRVVALAPSAVETVCALGWCDRLVGVGSYVSHPPQTADLPRLGGLVDADLERILLLEPELVILLESEADLAGKLRALDVEVLSVPADSLADIGRAAEKVAARFADSERARRWRRELEAALEPRRVDRRLRTLSVVGRPEGKPVKLLIPGEGTYLGELVGRAGGDAAIEGFGKAYREIDLATALAAQPEVILEFDFDAVDAEGRAADWDGIYPAQTNPPCHEAISGSHVVVPGPRVVELYADIVEALEGCRSRSHPATPPGGGKSLAYSSR